MKNPPTQNLLRELFHYDPETGIFIRRKSTSNRVKVGDVVGSLSKTSGYVRICVGSRLYKAHQLAWIYVHGSAPDRPLDHVNGVRSDNRIGNLRQANKQQNSANSKTNTRNRSGVKGVTWCRHAQKWMACIKVNYRTIYLGYFAEIADAAKARQAAAEKHFGEFAQH